MWKLALIFMIWTCAVSPSINTNSLDKLRYCVAKNTHKQKNYVDLNNLNNNNDSIEYIIVNERSNCLRQLIAGTADFTVFEPEDLVANYLNSYLESPVLVTHELRSSKRDKSRFEMVVLVSRDIQNFADLENRRFCHPGYDAGTPEWTRIFANYFQTWIMPKSCDNDKTLLENEISSLSTYFESACIAGPWTFDTKEDSRLKTKYRNLCALCDNPRGCYSDDKYYGREGALLCLTDRVGDVTWVRLQDTITHFYTEHIDKSQYNYLCPDGSSRPMDIENPCVWITKPWPVITARRGIAEKVSKKVEELSLGKESWKNNFLLQLENYHVSPVNTDVLETPGDYLNQFNGFASAYVRTACNPSRQIKWCVSSTLEETKCQWIRDIAFSYGIEPTLSCHLQSSHDACIEVVQKGICDFFVINPEELKKAYEKNTTSLLQLISKKSDNLKTYGILVKNNSKYFRIDDLKGARACFTSQHSVEWNAFIAVMQNRTKNLKWYCSSDEAVNHFFQSIIINNSYDKKYKNNNKNIDENSYINKKAFSASETYDCLTSGRGDVAFVNLNAKNDSYQSRYNLRTLCIDPKSNECTLTWTALGSVIVSVNMTELRRNEIHSMFMQLNMWFGSKYVGQTPALSLYGPFDAHENVIFPENTQSLQEDINYVRLPRNYLDILKQLKDETQSITCSQATSAINLILVFLSTSLIIINSP